MTFTGKVETPVNSPSSPLVEIRLPEKMNMNLMRNKLSRTQRALSQNILANGIEALERREMLSVTAATVNPILANTANPSANTVALNNVFHDPAITGTVVQFQTSQGTFDFALTDLATPITVKNFLAYVNSGAYNGSFFHRAVSFANGTTSKVVPPATASIFQGGGYKLDNSGQIVQIPVDTSLPTVTNEVATETQTDIVGTIAMAKPANSPDGATNEFFFNTADNTSILSDHSNDGGFATFGNVIGDGLTVLNKLAALPGYADPNFAELPLQGVTEADIQKSGFSITTNMLVALGSVSVVDGITYTVTSDNPALVTPTVTNGNLSFTYGAGLFGEATISITATSAAGGTAAENIGITVPDPSNPTAPIAAHDDIAPNFLVGSSNQKISPLLNDTDSLFALNPATLTITTQPAHGTASVSGASGVILYTPAAGYLGPDTLQYTITDTGGNVSAPATVSLNIVPNSTTVTIGTPTARQLNYTDPDGTVSSIRLSGGTAAITFASFDVTTTTANGIVTATGNGATISNIVFTPTKHAHGSFSVTSTGGDGIATIGGFQDTGILTSFKAPGVTLSGSVGIGNAANFTVGKLDHASVSFGFGGVMTSINVPVVSDSSVAATLIRSIKSTQWLNTDGGVYTLTASGILSMNITGEFAEDITLAKGYLLAAKIGNLSGGLWQIAGLVGSVTASAVNKAWTLDSNNLVRNLKFGGDFSSNLNVAAVGTMTVAGNISDSIIQTSASLFKSFVQFKKLSVGGSITGSIFYAAGNFGALSAASFIDSALYAGVSLSVAQAGALPAAPGDFTGKAFITSVRFGGPHPSFSNSKIAAYQIGSASLGIIKTANGGNAHGMAMHSAKSISGSLDTGGTLHLGPAQLASQAVLDKYIKDNSLNKGDLKLAIV